MSIPLPPLPELPKKPDISVPFLWEAIKVYQGDYYRADTVLPLLKQWAKLHAHAAAVSAERDAEIAQLRQYLDAAQRRGEELRAQVAALEVLLDDAIEEIEGWGEYAPAYFKQKHDLEGTLAWFRAARKGEA